MDRRTSEGVFAGTMLVLLIVGFGLVLRWHSSPPPPPERAVSYAARRDVEAAPPTPSEDRAPKLPAASDAPVLAPVPDVAAFLGHFGGIEQARGAALQRFYSANNLIIEVVAPMAFVGPEEKARRAPQLDRPRAEMEAAAAAFRSLQQTLRGTAAPAACQELVTAYDALLDSTARGLEAKERTLRQRQQDPSSIGNLGEATRQLQTELSWQREVEGHQEQVVAALDRLRQANSGLPPEATGYRIEPVRWGPQN